MKQQEVEAAAKAKASDNVVAVDEILFEMEEDDRKPAARREHSQKVQRNSSGGAAKIPKVSNNLHKYYSPQRKLGSNRKHYQPNSPMASPSKALINA